MRLEGRVLVSLPTLLVAFARYSRDGSLGMFPNLVLIPLLAVILLVSAIKLARHD
ncbi:MULTISPECIES: hypothetical protein [unclassified Streptomyces]|uniref:hypothetical protein n=1 Tax=unclassified Streptomyces TaxID=2593676 RepID=UPI0020A63F95|nr:hypothetical protein [Streptomyces sp. CNQ-509]